MKSKKNKKIEKKARIVEAGSWGYVGSPVHKGHIATTLFQVIFGIRTTTIILNNVFEIV